MSPPTRDPCIDADPDITGIGVMIALFFPAFINIIVTVIAALDREISPEEAEAILGLSKENLSLSGALILTALIQLMRGRLSAYHALMVLQMTWVLEGPLMTSYQLLNSLFNCKNWKGAIDVLDTETSGRTASRLSRFRLVHGCFAVIIWMTIVCLPGWLKCADETFLWPRSYVARSSLKYFFALLSFVRLLEALWVIRKGSSGKSSGEHQGKKVHGVVVCRTCVALALLAWVIFGTFAAMRESGRVHVVALGEANFGFGQILALVNLVQWGHALLTKNKRRKQLRILLGILGERILRLGLLRLLRILRVLLQILLAILALPLGILGQQIILRLRLGLLLRILPLGILRLLRILPPGIPPGILGQQIILGEELRLIGIIIGIMGIIELSLENDPIS